MEEKKNLQRTCSVCRHAFTKVFLDARGHAASHHSTINSSATERCACLVECFHSYGVHSLIFLNRNNIAAQDFYITKIVELKCV